MADRRRDMPHIRWVFPETLHVTLKFYGEIQLDMVEALKKHLAAMKQKGAFTVSIGGINGFPCFSVPNTIWTGLKTDSPRIKEIFAEVERASLRIGVDRAKKPLRPHITLGRRNTSEPLDIKTLDILEKNQPQTDPWNVKSVVLMRSELFSRGPRYTTLGVFKI